MLSYFLRVINPVPRQFLGWACIYVLRLLVCSQSPLGHGRAESSHNLLQCSLQGPGQETDRWYSGRAGPGYPGAEAVASVSCVELR